MKAVTFDLWHTLLWDPPVTARSFHQVADEHRVTRLVRNLSRLGRRMTRQEVEEAYRRHVKGLIQTWRQFEDVSVEGRMARLAADLDMAWPDEELDAALRDAVGSVLLRYPPRVSEGAREALEVLRARDVAIGIISNTGTTWGEALRPVLENAGLSGLLAVTTFSDEVGVRKPRPEIFRKTLARLGAEPADAVHVGDRMLADVAGAKAAGMRGVLFTNGREPPEAYRGADAVLVHFSHLPAILDVLA
jgi:putative hydrolase of the HAD superfamily